MIGAPGAGRCRPAVSLDGRCPASGEEGFTAAPLREGMGEDEEAVSECLLMVRTVVSSSDSGLSPVAVSPLHITSHNSTHLAVWGLRGLGIKSVGRPNGRRNS